MSAAELTSGELTSKEVQHVAKLSRLAIDSACVESMRSELTRILSHIAKLQALDTDGVEPMAHPMRLTNRLAADVPVDGMSIEEFLMNAPATEGRFLAVPKVLADGGGA